MQTFERCSAVGLTQSRKSYKNMLDELGAGLIHTIKKMLQDGHELRFTFDNFDFRILTNIIIKGYQNSDMHWISQYATFDRVSSSGLEDTKPIVSNIKDYDNSNYLMSSNELKAMRDDFIILVSRVLVEYFQCLQSLRTVVPIHIMHHYSEEMSKAFHHNKFACCAI